MALSLLQGYDSDQASSSDSEDEQRKAKRFARKIDALVTNLKTLTEGREAGGGKSKGELKLPQYPKAPQYKAWLNKVRTALCKHVPKRAAQVLQWVLEVYVKGATREQFENSGSFPELDVELSNAVIGIVHGELAREINAFVDAQQRRGVVPKGRQLLLMAHNDHRTNEEFGAI